MNKPDTLQESKYPYTFEPKAMLRLTDLGMMALKAIDHVRVERLTSRGSNNPEVIAQYLSSRIGPDNVVVMTEQELDDTLGPLLVPHLPPLIESEVIPEPPICPQPTS